MERSKEASYTIKKMFITPGESPRVINLSYVRLSYPHLLTPYKRTAKKGESDDQEQPKFSAVLVMARHLPGAKEVWTGLVKVAKLVGKEDLGIDPMQDQKHKPIKDGREAAAAEAQRKARMGRNYIPENTMAADIFTIRGTAQPDKPPLLTTRDRTPTKDPDLIKELFYPGAIVQAQVRCFTFDRRGNKGVTWGLNALRFLKDAPRLDSQATPESLPNEGIDDVDDEDDAGFSAETVEYDRGEADDTSDQFDF